MDMVILSGRREGPPASTRPLPMNSRNSHLGSKAAPARALPVEVGKRLDTLLSEGRAGREAYQRLSKQLQSEVADRRRLEAMVVASQRELTSAIADRKRLEQSAIADRKRLERSLAAAQKELASKKRCGVVVTTHGRHGAYARNCVHSFLKHMPPPFYLLLVINVSDDPVARELEMSLAGVSCAETVRLEQDRGGLTETWNLGIERCAQAGCDVVVLSNHDLYVDSSISHIVDEAKKCSPDDLHYYGPLTNNPGPAACNDAQRGVQAENAPARKHEIEGSLININGFLMAIPMHVLRANMFSQRDYFDPAKPYRGNETEWHTRLMQKQGSGWIVPRTFVHHYKFAAWREGTPTSFCDSNEVCIYTINTGGYETGVSCRGDLFGDECDMLYLSDSPEALREAASKGWVPMYISPGPSGAMRECKLLQRTAKTRPHFFLPSHYSVSIYIDGNLAPAWPSVSSFLESIHIEDCDLACWAHPDRVSVSTEGEAVVSKRLETQENVDTILRMQRDDGYPDDGGLTETNLLVRKHNNIREFSDEWCQCVGVCRRDQISFDYLLWKHKVRVNTFPFGSKPVLKSRHTGDISLRKVREFV